MKVTAKGKAVQYTFNDGSKTIQYSLGTTDSFGNLRTSEYSDGKGRHDTLSKWQEVEITPVVHVPEDNELCAVWDGDSRPIGITPVRYSTGKLDNGKLVCYSEYNKNATIAWEHWEEI